MNNNKLIFKSKKKCNQTKNISYPYKKLIGGAVKKKDVNCTKRNPYPPCDDGFEIGGHDKSKPGCCYKSKKN